MFPCLIHQQFESLSKDEVGKDYNLKRSSKIVEKNIKNREKNKRQNMTILLTFVNVALILNLKANKSK